MRPSTARASAGCSATSGGRAVAVTESMGGRAIGPAAADVNGLAVKDWRPLRAPLPTAAMADAAAPSARALLQERDYILFWASRWLGSLGSQVQSVAMGWLVYDLSRTAGLSIKQSAFNVSLIGL